MNARAHGYGLATLTPDGRVLDTWYPTPEIGTVSATHPEPDALTRLGGTDSVRGVERLVVHTVIDDLEAPPTNAYDVYLRLHLLSHRLRRPRTINLDGIYDLLTTVVWTSIGPCPVDGFETIRARAQATGLSIQVSSVDKFPRMTDYVVPTEVRIADADRVRLGAYLSPGTTVMHEGFVNFNAGTLGRAMVEGRISAGVTVGDGSDIGGGASIMGKLSGGGTEVVTVGKNSLLGANSGIGIAIGDNCVVAAGCYVTAGTKVSTPDGSVVKAVELAGKNNLLFLLNSQTGRVEVRVRERVGVELNDSLHAN